MFLVNYTLIKNRRLISVRVTFWSTMHLLLSFSLFNLRSKTDEFYIRVAVIMRIEFKFFGILLVSIF